MIITAYKTKENEIDTSKIKVLGNNITKQPYPVKVKDVYMENTNSKCKKDSQCITTTYKPANIIKIQKKTTFHLLESLKSNKKIRSSKNSNDSEWTPLETSSETRIN